MRWSVVPIRAVALAVDIEPGELVPGRVVVMEALRRDGRVPGFNVGAEADAIDWTGLDEAVRELDALDVMVRRRWGRTSDS